MACEYIIYSDESDQKGRFFSNFYGGVLVQSTDLQKALQVLSARKLELGLGSEVKWSKVTEQYLDRYIELMETFFDLVATGKIRVRIMFRQNSNEPVGLEPEHRSNEYHLLYYQFLKHAFGLAYCHGEHKPVRLRLYFDRLQGTSEQISRFKDYLARLGRQPAFRHVGVFVDREQIAEVNSHEHILLQCLDVVMGAMQFRLNDKHREKPPGSRIRGKKTRAKEKLYKRILARILRLYPGFNIGITTGTQGDPANRWKHPYRHWSFVPKNSRWDSSKTK